MGSLGSDFRVLVTGGAGFLGAVVTRRLVREGYAVRVMDDLSRGRRARLAGLEIELMVADVRVERYARDACADVTAVVHLASGMPRPQTTREERQAHDVTVTGTLNLVLAAREAQVARFVHVSSAAVYGGKLPYLLHEDAATHPTTAEGAQKLAAEGYVRLHGAHGLPACVLRPFSVYGPDQDAGGEDGPLVARFVAAARARAPLTIHGDGSQTRDFVHVDDVAEAIVRALRTPAVVGRTFNLATGESVAVRHLAGIVSDLAGGLPPPRFFPARPGSPQDLRASVAAAASGLGWRARIRLRDGLRACLSVAAAATRDQSGGRTSGPVTVVRERPAPATRYAERYPTPATGVPALGTTGAPPAHPGAPVGYAAHLPATSTSATPAYMGRPPAATTVGPGAPAAGGATMTDAGDYVAGPDVTAPPVYAPAADLASPPGYATPPAYARPRSRTRTSGMFDALLAETPTAQAPPRRAPTPLTVYSPPATAPPPRTTVSGAHAGADAPARGAHPGAPTAVSGARAGAHAAARGAHPGAPTAVSGAHAGAHAAARGAHPGAPTAVSGAHTGAPARPARIPPPAGFPPASDPGPPSREAADVPAIAAPAVDHGARGPFDQDPPLFADRPPSWMVRDEGETSLAGESSRRWNP